MITKILKSFRSGSGVYHNKGSCRKLLRYLGHEARAEGRGAVYFNQSREGIAEAAVAENIDRNGKGLRTVDARFYSLVISPSADELRHIGNDAERLKAYTRQVMENYAGSYTRPDGQKLDGEQLVWFATFHHGRAYKGQDPAVKDGTVQRGESKGEYQLHVHVVVSRLSRDGAYSLTPAGSKERFNIQEWQKQNAGDFGRLFGYSKQVYFSKDEQKEGRLRERLDKFMQAHHLERSYLNPDRVVFLAKEQDYNWKFYRHLHGLEQTLEKGIRPPDPYERLVRDAVKGQSRAPGQGNRQEHPRQFHIAPDKAGSLPEKQLHVQPGKDSAPKAEVPAAAHKDYGGGTLAALSRLAGALAHETGMPGEDWSSDERLRKNKPKRRRLHEGLSPER